LALLAARFTAMGWVSREAFRDAMVYLTVSCGLCVSFAGVALLFFATVKPGISKLRYYVTYFNIMENRPLETNHTAFWTRIKTRTAAILVCILAVAVLFFLALRQPSTPDSLSLAINSTALASTPVFVAADQHPAGLRITEFSSGRSALDALLGGQADLATVAETPVVTASLARPDIRLILTIAESQYRIVARRSAGISSLQGLKGKRVGTIIGASPEYFLSAILQRNGMSEADVSITNYQPADLVTAITKRGVDAIAIWEPQAQDAVSVLGTDAVVLDDPDAYTERFNLVTTEEILSNPSKRANILRFVQHIIDASGYIQQQKQATILLVAQKLQLQPDKVNVVWNRFSFPANLDEAKLLPELAGVEIWDAKQKDRLPRDTTALRSLIDNSVLLSAQNR